MPTNQNNSELENVVNAFAYSTNRINIAGMDTGINPNYQTLRPLVPPIPTPPFICQTCSNSYPIEYQETVNNVVYCRYCYRNRYHNCYNCDDRIDRQRDVFSYDSNDNPICENCRDEYYMDCDRCGNLYHENNLNNGYCELCVEERESEIQAVTTPPRNPALNFRDYAKSNKYVSEDTETVKYRIFSTEIECYFKSDESMIKAYETLPKELGITHDGSLNSNSNGREMITPLLSGKLGDKFLKDTCKALKDNDFIVDKSCGLHIHIDTTGLHSSYYNITKLMVFYMVFEPVIYSFLPYSRRINRFCLPLTDFYHMQEIVNCNSIQELEKIWYREQNMREIGAIKKKKYHQSRYSGVNLHSMFSHGNLEIRHHSGTIDYNKIRMWLDLHIAIVDLIASGNVELSALMKIRYFVTLEERQKEFFKLLNLPKAVKDYFIARQEKFTIVTDKNKEICAE